MALPRAHMASKPQSIAGRAELAWYTLTRALITGGNATLTPAVIWPPLFPALYERGRICRAYAVKSPIFPRSLFKTIGVKRPWEWPCHRGVLGRRKPLQGANPSSWGTKCHGVRDARPLQDLRSSRKIAKHLSGSAAAQPLSWFGM